MLRNLDFSVAPGGGSTASFTSEGPAVVQLRTLQAPPGMVTVQAALEGMPLQTIGAPVVTSDRGAIFAVDVPPGVTVRICCAGDVVKAALYYAD